MNFDVREGRFDVVIAAGPRVDPWPSAGVRALSILCAEMGLTVGLIGGEALRAKGVFPLPGTGGLLLAEDAQSRIHRIHARAIVRVRARSELCDPFPGWYASGLIPLSTAQRLFLESRVSWSPHITILGTGNQALRFGARLLETVSAQVVCVEPQAELWGPKRYAGWEVERRRFEIAGGRIIEAKPMGLSQKSALVWQLKLEDPQGVRIIDTTRVISAGPFTEPLQALPGVREYPPGSFLYELEQTAGPSRAEDVEGWVIEEERGRWLAGKIVRALADDLGGKREELERILKRAKVRLRRYTTRHLELPFVAKYQGKWTASEDSRRIREFSGVPVRAQKLRPVASIECFENIPCDLCERACPESAISFRPRRDRLATEPILNEAACTACGACLPVCPSKSTLLIEERDDAPTSRVTLITAASAGGKNWSAGEFGTLVNRRGNSLGSARVVSVHPDGYIEVDVPTHLVWEARGLRETRAKGRADSDYLGSIAPRTADLVEVTFNGERRQVRDHVPLTVAFYDTGYDRAQDNLYCPDGSCGLCQCTVDGVRKLACQTQVRRGMSIRLDLPRKAAGASGGTGQTGSGLVGVVALPAGSSSPSLANTFDTGHAAAMSRRGPLPISIVCPCLGITSAQIHDRIEHAKIQSPDAARSATHVGEGRCQGQFCRDGFQRQLQAEGLEVSSWIDWRFPWTEWRLGSSRS